MLHTINYNVSKDHKRWLAYFDILGISDLIRSKNYLEVFETYAGAIERCKRQIRNHNKIHAMWFSDTFLFYSEGNSAGDFLSLNSISGWFIYFMISKEIPVRGAISCDQFYADKEHALFFGEALLEAHKYGESQDWLGFLLCPSAVKQLRKVGSPAENFLNYAYWDIPFTKDISENTARLPAFILGDCADPVYGRYLSALKRMRKKGTTKAIVQKYDNTIAFIKANNRTAVSRREKSD